MESPTDKCASTDRRERKREVRCESSAFRTPNPRPSRNGRINSRADRAVYARHQERKAGCVAVAVSLTAFQNRGVYEQAE